jgi:DUF4097 and DUF4098 domain-containing protein YvlB
MKTKLLLAGFALFLAWTCSTHAVATENPKEVTKSFTVSKGGIVELETEGGDIKVSTWDKSEVFVRAEGIEERDLHRLKMTQSGNTIVIRYRSGGGWFSRGRDVHFSLTLPTQFDLDAQTSGGDIVVRGPLSGTLKGSTSGGDVKLGDLGGTITMTTSGGDITGDKLNGDSYLKTSGGDIRVSSVGGDAEINTSGGDISVDYVKKDLRAKTSGGDINIGEVGGAVAASTAGGDIKIRKSAGNVTASTAGGDIRMGSASGTVKAKTAGGDIRLERINGSVEAKTAGGEVEAELVPSGKGRSRLATAGGDVRLFIPESACATIEARIRVHGWWGADMQRYNIKSDYKAETFERSKDDEEIHGTYILNGGGESISLETVNSDIEIRKARK